MAYIEQSKENYMSGKMNINKPVAFFHSNFMETIL